jgi:hypothetical protein
MRHSLNLLRILIELHPCYNTEENIEELETAMTDMEELRRLRILRDTIKACPEVDGESLWNAWQSVFNKEESDD